MRSAVAALVFALVANATANVLIRWGMRDQPLSLAQPVAALKGILLNGRVLAGMALAYGAALVLVFVSARYRVAMLPLLVVAAAVFLFIVEWVRVDVVGILMMVLLPLAGLISPKEAFVGLSSNAVCSIIAVIIIGYQGQGRTSAIIKGDCNHELFFMV